MASIRSLVVKIGAQTEEIDKALARVGSNAKKTDEDLKKLGNTPIGQAAMQSFREMEAAMNGITKAQQAVADRAKTTAAGIDQIGGVTKFTKNELDQLNKTLQNGLDAFRALGQAAPKDLQRVADAVTKQKKALEGTTAQTGLMGQAQSLLTSKLVAFAGPAALGAVVKQSLAYADSLSKLSERTGIGTTALQRMGAVATASGNTLDQVAGAVSKFQAAFAAGKADDVVRSLGLSIAQLKAQSPDEQFFAIAKALQAIEDPAKFAQKATEAFGKGGIEIIPTLKANIDGLKDSTVTMSAESVKALDEFGDMLGRWKVGAVNAIGEVTAAAITLVTNILKLPAAMRDMQDLSKTSTSVPGLIGGRGVLSDEEIKTLSPEELQRRLQARLTGARPDVIPKPSTTLPGLPTIAAPTGDALEAIVRAYEHQREKLNEVNKEQIEYIRALEAVDKKIKEATRPITALTTAQKQLVFQYDEIGLSAQETAVKFNVGERSVIEYKNAVEDTLEGMQRNREETGRMQAAIGNLAVGIRTGEKATIGFKGVLQETDPALLKVTSTTKQYQDGLTKLQDVGKGAIEHSNNFTEAIEKEQEAFKKGSFHMDDFTKSMAQLAQISGESFGGLVQDIAKVVAAFELATKAAKQFNLINPETGRRSPQNIAGGILQGVTAGATATGSGSTGARVLGGAATGAAIGSVIPGLGTAAGAAIGAGVGLIRGLLSAGEQKQVNDIRDAWEDTIGTFDQLHAKANAAGVSLTRYLSADTVEEFEAAVAELENAFNDLDEATQRYGLTFHDLHDEHRRLAEGQTIVEDLVDTFNDLTRAGYDADTVLSEMSGDFQGALLSLQEAGVLDDLIGDLVDLGRISQDTADTLLNIGKKGPDFEALTRRASEFGINLQMLGPAFQQANITGTAQNILTLFNDLTEAGGDAGGIMNGLKEEVSELLQGAITFGSAIPNAMRPMIEQMARAGLLTDAAGNKIEDLSGVTFADTPLEEGLDNLNTAIRDLIAALTGDLPNAINNIPPVDVDVRYNVPDLQLPGSSTEWNMNVAAQGGLVTPDGIQRFASGGRVLPFLRRGTDTVPAMLTPGELVLNQGQQEAVRDALAGGSSPGASFKRVESLLEQMGKRAERSDALLPHQIARYVRDAVQTAKGRR